MEKIREKLVYGIREYFEDIELDKAVVGLSGGVDSATTAFLTVEALGSENVIGVSMPEEGLSANETKDYAKLVADKLGIKFEIVPINLFLEGYNRLPWGSDKVSDMNTKARVRATILYHLANKNNALVMGTGNKTELVLGYFTKYGDGAVDIEVLGNLWKKDVFKLASLIGVPQEIVSRTPTAELYHGHTDEDELGAKYSVIDEILIMLEEGKSKDEIVNKFGEEIVTKLLERIDKNKHKSSSPPCLEV